MKAFLVVILVYLPLSSCIKLFELALIEDCKGKTGYPDLACIGVAPNKNDSQHDLYTLSTVRGEGCWKDFSCYLGLVVKREEGRVPLYTLFAKKNTSPPISEVLFELAQFEKTANSDYRIYLTFQMNIQLAEKGRSTCSGQITPMRVLLCNTHDDQPGKLFAGVFGIRTIDKEEIHVGKLDITSTLYVTIKVIYRNRETHYIQRSNMLFFPRSVSHNKSKNEKRVSGWAIALIAVVLVTIGGHAVWFGLKRKKGKQSKPIVEADTRNWSESEVSEVQFGRERSDSRRNQEEAATFVSPLDVCSAIKTEASAAEVM